jgi:integrase
LPAEFGAAAQAATPVIELTATTDVFEHQRLVAFQRVPRAPLHQGDQDGPQLDALVGEPVLIARRAFVVALAVQHALLDESGEPAALYTGLRRGELMALRWSDVDLTSGTVTVRRSWDRMAGPVEPKSRAGGAGRADPRGATAAARRSQAGDVPRR